MAISKIKINNVEHELQTTIQNVSGLEAQLNNKISSNQGTANSGKVLGIGADGLVVPTESGGMASLRHDSANKTVVLENISVGDTVAAGLTGLGITATAEELNYMDGVTSNVQGQLDAKVESLSDLGITASASRLNKTAAYFRNDDKTITDIETAGSVYVTSLDDSKTMPIVASEFQTSSGHKLTEKANSSDLSNYATLTGSEALTNKTYNGYTLGAACAKDVYDRTSATAIGTGTSLSTDRRIYYGLPTINGSHVYNSNYNIYAPTKMGTKGQVLVSKGSGTPNWKAMSDLIKIQSGTLSLNNGSDWERTSGSVTFPSAFSVAPIVQASTTEGDAVVHVTSISKTGCTISLYAAASRGTKTIRWTAMGY